MEDVTLTLALLLACGIAVAKVGQKLKLPSVTGYILTGLILGPSGFALVTTETIAHQLDHFTEIALMLIAFGIGEQIELKRLRKSAGVIGVIGVMEATSSFLLVTATAFTFASFFALNSGSWILKDYLMLAVLLGSISVATAPATTLHVIRELQAKGSLTSTLMAVVAVNNGMAIIFFGIAMAVADQIVGSGAGALTMALLAGMTTISLSLVIGVLTGLAISYFLPRLKIQGEMLTVGLALLLFCGEIARMFALSPLLAGMAAGFTVINRVTRDVRLFRALNAFEPPIYVLFFTIAGTHLDIFSLGAAGWFGLVYFAFRMLGKYCGAYCGAFLSRAPIHVRNFLGLALVPQAGVAIGLVFLINSNENFVDFSAIITPVVLAGVILSEISGPVFVRFAVERAGESYGAEEYPQSAHKNGREVFTVTFPPTSEEISIVPWTWEKLTPHPHPEGVVSFGASHPWTVCGLARMATIFAHHFKATPLSVRVVKPGVKNLGLFGAMENLFSGEKEEVESLGYKLETELVPQEDVASGLVSAVEYNNSKAVVLGYPLKGTAQAFQKILETVADNVACPVVVVKFYGELHTEKILVPLVSMEDLDVVGPIVHALSRVGQHRIKLLFLMSADESDEAVGKIKIELKNWLRHMKITSTINYKIVRTEARDETILSESVTNDLVVMGTTKKNVLKRLFFGSLAETVAAKIKKPLLIVYRPSKEALLSEFEQVHRKKDIVS